MLFKNEHPSVFKKKIIICSNTAWNLWNFRRNLIMSLLDYGYEVVALAPVDECAPKLELIGCRFIDFPIDRGSVNPLVDLHLFYRFIRTFQVERPHIYLGFTIKPNIFGTLAAQFFKTISIINITGLGATFIKRSLLTRVVKFLYSLSLKKSFMVFFQNEDDCKYFMNLQMVNINNVRCLPGSGIDLSEFKFTNMLPLNKRRFRFLLIGRILWDKGIGEYVEAARLLKRDFPAAEWCVLGGYDVHNPTAISQKQFSSWSENGFINYLGVTDDVQSEIVNADCVVLPSYREGTPRVLLEAAAIGRPIIATNAVGCREVVTHGLNGFLCEPQSAIDLATQMRLMLNMSPAQRELMGKEGRLKMERDFDVVKVVNNYTEVIDNAINNNFVPLED